MKVFASIVDTKGKKQTFALREKPILIGRSTSAHVTISDDLSSGTHCMISFIDGCVYIEDLESKNGLFLNGIKVLKQRVYIDDKIKIGNTFLYLESSKMDEESIKQITSTTRSKRDDGELTLELDTFTGKKKLNDPKPVSNSLNNAQNSKLYAGVKENKVALSKIAPTGIKLTILEGLALLVDISLSLGLFLVLLLSLGKEVTLVSVKSGTNLYILIGSLVVSFILFKWNRGAKKASIGEKLFGLD